jgi:hypothetical protein
VRRPPRRARLIWLASGIVLALALGLILFYLRATAGWSPRAATPLGRWYGGIGAGLMLVLGLYWARRGQYRSRLGSLELWYRAHLWLGVIALALLGAHSGFACRGIFLTTLQCFFWGAMLTGLIGWLFQTWLKARLARYEGRPLVLAQIATEREAAVTALASLVPSAKEADLLHARRRLAALRRRHLWRFPSWATWEAMVAAQGGHALANHLNAMDPADAACALGALERLNRLEVLASYHRWLRGWTTLHLALALGVLQLAVWHIVTTTRY